MGKTAKKDRQGFVGLQAQDSQLQAVRDLVRVRPIPAYLRLGARGRTLTRNAHKMLAACCECNGQQQLAASCVALPPNGPDLRPCQ